MKTTNIKFFEKYSNHHPVNFTNASGTLYRWCGEFDCKACILYDAYEKRTNCSNNRGEFGTMTSDEYDYICEKYPEYLI